MTFYLQIYFFVLSLEAISGLITINQRNKVFLNGNHKKQSNHFKKKKRGASTLAIIRSIYLIWVGKGSLFRF